MQGDSETSVVSLVLLGMTISVAVMSKPDGSKSLAVKPVAAGTAELTTAGNTAIWNISSEAWGRSDAGAGTIFSGAARNVIGESTTEK